MRTNRHITWPKRVCFAFGDCWDGALTMNFLEENRVPKGPHALCDVDGNNLKLSDVKDGMSVKIRTKYFRWFHGGSRFHAYAGYEYLFTAYGRYGKYLAI